MKLLLASLRRAPLLLVFAALACGYDPQNPSAGCGAPRQAASPGNDTRGNAGGTAASPGGGGGNTNTSAGNTNTSTGNTNTSAGNTNTSAGNTNSNQPEQPGVNCGVGNKPACKGCISANAQGPFFSPMPPRCPPGVAGLEH